MKRVLFILLLIFSVFFFTRSEVGQLLLQGEIDSIALYMNGLGSIAYVLTFIFVMVQAFFPYVPFIVLAGVCVLLFGLKVGFLLCWLATSVGAVLTFYTARYLARDWAEHRVRHLPFVQKFNKFASKNGFLTILLCRLSAVVPSSIINLTAGISRIDRKSFIIATFVGNLPVTFIESWLGHIVFHFEKQNGKYLILIFLLIGVVIYFKKRWKRME